jgi:tetratricopeptide (TPR) repeat protein
MSTEESKPDGSASGEAKVQPASLSSDPPAEPAASPPAEAAAAPPANVDAAVAWPPPEAAPDGDAAPAPTNGTPLSTATASAPDAEKAAEPTPADSGVMTAPEVSPAAKAPAAANADMPAATPQEEMGLSNSTLHWLEDGDQAVPGRLTDTGTGSMASYDPHAPVPGRKRGVLVVAIPGLMALVVAGMLYARSEKRRAEQPPAAPAAVEPARDLTSRAEAALAANRPDEALELAHLALVADQRFADAHFVVGSVEQARGQNNAAREEFRRYLELAPLGTHAAAARTALSSLPP